MPEHERGWSSSSGPGGGRSQGATVVSTSSVHLSLQPGIRISKRESFKGHVISASNAFFMSDHDYEKRYRFRDPSQVSLRSSQRLKSRHGRKRYSVKILPVTFFSSDLQPDDGACFRGVRLFLREKVVGARPGAAASLLYLLPAAAAIAAAAA